MERWLRIQWIGRARAVEGLAKALAHAVMVAGDDQASMQALFEIAKQAEYDLHMLMDSIQEHVGVLK